jgi:cytochrome c oxidase assembly protein Cox11
LSPSNQEGGGCILTVLVFCVALAFNSVGIAGMFAKSIAIANHTVSMCDRHATTDLRVAKAIATKFKQCIEGF